MEPNIFTVVKWGSDNLIYLDIYEIFNQEYIDSKTVDPENHINGLYAWKDIEPIFSTTKYNEFKEWFM